MGIYGMIFCVLQVWFLIWITKRSRNVLALGMDVTQDICSKKVVH